MDFIEKRIFAPFRQIGGGQGMKRGAWSRDGRDRKTIQETARPRVLDPAGVANTVYKMQLPAYGFDKSALCRHTTHL